MTKGELLREEVLENGLRLEFWDQSNRYFGDYHRVRVLVRLRLSLTAGPLADRVAQPILEQARVNLGDELIEEQVLEKMGVAGADLEVLRQEQIDRFLTGNRAYLARPAYVERLLARQLGNRPRRPRLEP